VIAIWCDGLGKTHKKHTAEEMQSVNTAGDTVQSALALLWYVGVQ